LARKILLADDSVTAQNMGRKILADAGYDVVTVNNGSAALKRIAELKPDLIVLDVYMPGYSGLEVCQRLKDAGETARIPVLLTVGKLEPFKAEEARRVRADAHIVKPFEASELLTAISRLEEMATQRAAGNDASAETGWTTRLSFPSKKKKDGAESEDVAAGAGFRDFRRGKGKTSAGAAPPDKAPGQDAGLVPEIPHDITPEELDALSALAAKLDTPAPAVENSAPAAEPLAETPAPGVDQSPAVTAAEFAVETPVSAVERKNEFEMPAETAAPVVETAAAVPVNTAHLAQEPAPVDRNDEPMFESAASAQAEAQAQAEDPAPSDAELTEALRLLTPATGHADGSTVPSCGTDALPAESAAHDAEAGPRWIAEPVALSPEEAAMSLEAEMFRTFAAMPATAPTPSPSAETEPTPATGVSAIAAAVESRLAKAALAAASTPLPDEKSEPKDSAVEVPAQVPAEEFVAAPQEAPMAMAAAAAADGTASARDARAIANIVDSVLADLRPKILEEITKKLAGK